MASNSFSPGPPGQTLLYSIKLLWWVGYTISAFHFAKEMVTRPTNKMIDNQMYMTVMTGYKKKIVQLHQPISTLIITPWYHHHLPSFTPWTSNHPSIQPWGRCPGLDSAEASMIWTRQLVFATMEALGKGQRPNLKATPKTYWWNGMTTSSYSWLYLQDFTSLQIHNWSIACIPTFPTLFSQLQGLIPRYWSTFSAFCFPDSGRCGSLGGEDFGGWWA